MLLLKPRRWWKFVLASIIVIVAVPVSCHHALPRRPSGPRFDGIYVVDENSRLWATTIFSEELYQFQGPGTNPESASREWLDSNSVARVSFTTRPPRPRGVFIPWRKTYTNLLWYFDSYDPRWRPMTWQEWENSFGRHIAGLDPIADAVATFLETQASAPWQWRDERFSNTDWTGAHIAALRGRKKEVTRVSSLALAGELAVGSIALWSAAYLALGLPHVRSDLRAAKWRREGRCPSCGYEVEKLSLCPECGEPTASPES